MLDFQIWVLLDLTDLSVTKYFAHLYYLRNVITNGILKLLHINHFVHFETKIQIKINTGEWSKIKIDLKMDY